MIHTDRKRSTTDRLLNTEGAAPPAEERLAEVSSGDVERSASTSTSAGGRWYAGRCLSPSCSCRRPCGASRWSRDDADELCSAPRLRTAVEVAAAEGPAGSLGLCAAQSPAQNAVLEVVAAGDASWPALHQAVQAKRRVEALPIVGCTTSAISSTNRLLVVMRSMWSWLPSLSCSMQQVHFELDGAEEASPLAASIARSCPGTPMLTGTAMGCSLYPSVT